MCVCVSVRVIFDVRGLEFLSISRHNFQTSGRDGAHLRREAYHQAGPWRLNTYFPLLDSGGSNPRDHLVQERCQGARHLQVPGKIRKPRCKRAANVMVLEQVILKEENSYTTDCTLLLREVTVEDAGKYKVTAKNDLGESNATISLNFDSE